MKRFPILLLLATLLLSSSITSCFWRDKCQAYELLEEARAAYDRGEYELALTLLDSLNNSCPKSLKARTEALDLIRTTKIAQSSRDSNFIAPLLLTLYERQERLEQDFVKEVGEVINDVVYRYKGYKPSKDTALDVYIDEYGNFDIIATYCGPKPIKCSSISITSVQTGNFISSDTLRYDGGSNYRYTILDSHFERLTFTLDNANKMAEFVSFSAPSETFKVSFHSDEPGAKASFVIDKKCLEAIRHTYMLSRIRQGIEEYENQLAQHEKRRLRYASFLSKGGDQ